MELPLVSVVVRPSPPLAVAAARPRRMSAARQELPLASVGRLPDGLTAQPRRGDAR